MPVQQSKSVSATAAKATTIEFKPTIAEVFIYKLRKRKLAPVVRSLIGDNFLTSVGDFLASEQNNNVRLTLCRIETVVTSCSHSAASTRKRAVPVMVSSCANS